MKFSASLIVVSDMQRSKAFYETVLGQTVKFDFGENIMFESGISIHLKPHFALLTGIPEASILNAPNNFELFFEEDDFDGFIERLANFPDIRFVHQPIECSWGQRVIRFYDPDMHIIEVGESVQSVFKKLYLLGYTLEETAIKSQHPVEFIKPYYEKFENERII